LHDNVHHSTNQHALQKRTQQHQKTPLTMIALVEARGDTVPVPVTGTGIYKRPKPAVSHTGTGTGNKKERLSEIERGGQRVYHTAEEIFFKTLKTQ
jgi:hypothetical protein